VVLLLGAALILTGCGGATKHTRTAKGELSIYTSLPFEGPYGSEAQAIYEGEELAWAQTGGVVNGVKVVLRRLDDATSGAGYSAAQVALNARIAAEDPSTVAYIGELTPGSSPASIRTLSAADILQVSPGDSATGLRAKTFARVVPSAFEDAEKDLELMSRPLVKTIYLIQDRTTYGRDVAREVRAQAASDGITILDRPRTYLPNDPATMVARIRRLKPAGLLYAGLPNASVPSIWSAVTAAEPTIKKFAAASITYSPNWGQSTAAARSARYNTYLSTPGLNRGLPRAGSEFESDFVATYRGRWPWQSGIFGYVAMSGVLDALHSLGRHPKNLRAGIVHAFMRIKNLPSALGTYSILGGQTTFQSYYFSTYTRAGTTTPFVPGLP
jgi:branched-chain amino acid transport system substrate-binding protein